MKSPELRLEQAPAPILGQYPAPYVPVQTTNGNGLDVSNIVSQIIPIFVIAMLFGIMTPMIKGFGGAQEAF